MKEYEYILTQRPAAPGALPREGLIRVENNDYRINGIWARAWYNRELSEKELRNYEMERVKN